MKESRNITPQKTMQILNENGKEYTIEQATEVLKLLYELADIEVEAFCDTSNTDYLRFQNAGLDVEFDAILNDIESIIDLLEVIEDESKSWREKLK